MALPPQLQAQEGALNEFIDILNDHVTNSIKLGKYIEAEIARLVLGFVCESNQLCGDHWRDGQLTRVS